MKQKLIIAIFLLTLTTKGLCQTTSGIDIKGLQKTKYLTKKVKNDSLPTVEFKTTTNSYSGTAFYINGKHCNATILRTIDPKDIDSSKVGKKEIDIDNTKYLGQIYINMKKGYSPKLISLTDLKRKYINPTGMSTIFMIDNDIIKENYANYLVDEKYILKIIVDTLENKEEKLHIQLIQLITRTEENIKKANEIRIRGNEEQLK